MTLKSSGCWEVSFYCIAQTRRGKHYFVFTCTYLFCLYLLYCEPALLQKLNPNFLDRWECLNCSSGAISWQKRRIAGKGAGRGTAGWEVDTRPAPMTTHCLTVFCWDYFWLSLMLQKMNQDSWPSYFPGLFNLRGSDVEYNPVFFAYAVIGMNTIRCLYSPFLSPKMHFSVGELF